VALFKRLVIARLLVTMVFPCLLIRLLTYFFVHVLRVSVRRHRLQCVERHCVSREWQEHYFKSDR